MKRLTGITHLFACGLVFLAAGCSGGSSTAGADINIEHVSQDLSADPDGLTTRVTLDTEPLTAPAAANFEASGGQSASSVSSTGTDFLVVWDERVTPSHQVRITGVGAIDDGFVDVTTTDGAAPTFSVTDGIQNPGLGGDWLEVSFSGARVVPEQATDPANWLLWIDGQALDLAGSTIDFDVATQVASLTLGSGANLHASFQVAVASMWSVADVAVSDLPVDGTAAGDSTSPNLVPDGAAQNLVEDEYGRVLDFTFDEAMDPMTCLSVTNFLLPLPDIALNVTQPSPETLRVTFSTAVIPGVDQVTLLNLTDVHGNLHAGGPQDIVQLAPVENAFAASEATTVENEGEDYLSLSFDQAFDPDAAVDSGNWTLTVDGTPVDPAGQTWTYDFIEKTLRVGLDFDMKNGDAYQFDALAVLDVDGQSFTASATGVVSGDESDVFVTSAIQNRSLDPFGKTIEVTLSEDVEQSAAENAANWTFVGGSVNVLAATLQTGLDRVRVLTDAPPTPGDHTLTVSNLEDLAGNVMAAPQTAITITSTDSTPPRATHATASAIEGANNDELLVAFNDDIIATEAIDDANWSVESPVGTPVNTTGASISYDPTMRRATLVFADATGVNLQRGDDYSITLSGMRDIAGNEVVSAALTGMVVAEENLPAAHTGWRDSIVLDEVVVRFSEHCWGVADLWDELGNVEGTRYVLRDSLGNLRGTPSSAVELDDGLGVRLSFGFTVNAGDTLDVWGTTDLVGNYMFPVTAMPLASEDPSEPLMNLGVDVLEARSGESNDIITIDFDRGMSPWDLTDWSNYTVTDGGTEIDLSGASFGFQEPSTVSIELDSLSADNLQVPNAYTVSVDDVQSAQGVSMSAADSVPGVSVSGDLVDPSVGVDGIRRMDADSFSLLFRADEALDREYASTAGNYNYNNGNFGQTAVLVGPRVVRVSFAVEPQIGFPIAFGMTDLAGNFTGALVNNVAGSDSAPPLLVSVDGTSVPNRGGDFVSITFDEPVEVVTALDLSNYTVTNGANSVSLVGALARYVSGSNSVDIHLGVDSDLDPNQSLTIAVANVADHSGNAMSSTPVPLNGTIVGDADAPGIAAAFVNRDEDSSGLIVDVLFDEDVDMNFATDALNWSASAGQVIAGVLDVDPNYVRVVMLEALEEGDWLDLAAGLPDPARNTAGALSVTPEL
ncbi:MAG: hypothetical protein QF410_03155 [Planctomycetota bacterium]|nr:hypothetical protein [Planctomycetota bacterium]